MAEAKEHGHKQSSEPLGDRYGLVLLAREWVEVLQRMDDYREVGQSEIIKKALEDIQSGAVTAEDIRKARAKMRTTTEHGEEGKPEEKAAPAEEEPAKEKPAREEKASKKNEKSKK